MAENTKGGADDGKLREHAQDVLVTDVKAIASYNWLDEASPTIAVPGSPARWSPPAQAPLLSPDSGTHYIDHNKGRFPSSPFEPAVQAILHLHPKFDFSAFDVITDRWALSRLLSLAYDHATVSVSDSVAKQPSSSTPGEKFVFAAQLVGSTLVFFRQDDHDIKKDINQFSGFRKNFDKSHLRYEDNLANSVTHHRITAYKLGDLRLLIRHAGDGCFAAEEMTSESSMAESRRQMTAHSIAIVPAGKLLPPSSILEIVSIKQGNEKSDRLKEKCREAWVSQAGHFKVVKWQLRTPKGPKAADGFSHLRAMFPVAGMVDMAVESPPPDVRKRYKDILRKLTQDVLYHARRGGGDKYTITYFEGDEIPTVTPCSRIAALHFDLCERMRENGTSAKSS